MIKIIQDEKLNYKLNWITFDQFKSKEKYIISGREANLEEKGIEKLIELLRLSLKMSTRKNVHQKKIKYREISLLYTILI